MTHSITRRRFLASTTALAATTAAGTALSSSLLGAAESNKHQAALAALDAYIREHMAAIGAPGMIVSLAGRDGVLRVSQYGLADVKSRQPVRPQHLFEIGSITKSFTGVCAVQLQQEGRLDLHVPVTKYLPWLSVEAKYEPFTCHHLLSHTSGLAHDAPLFPNGAVKKLWSGFAPG